MQSILLEWGEGATCKQIFCEGTQFPLYGSLVLVSVPEGRLDLQCNLLTH